MSEVRQSKRITDKEILDKLYSLKSEDITSSLIYDLFGEFNGKAKVQPYDIITIPPGLYGKEGNKNKNSFITTVGLWLFNKWMIEDGLVDLFGYINTTINGKLFKEMNQTLSYALMEDKIDANTLKKYLIKTQLAMPYTTILSPNHSEKILTCTKAINKKKKELMIKYKKELDAGDVKVISDMEKELLDYAIDYMGDDPSMDSFISGARSNIHNHFKNMYVMKGAVRDADPNAKHEYSVAFSNYTDGMTADDYVIYCNSAATGAYSRGNKTAFGGYMENLFTAAFQNIVLDKEGSDCHTKRFKYVELTKDNVKLYMYCNIIDGNKLVELNSDNMDKYVGKKVKMRFPDLCENYYICNKCAGNFFYKLKIRNVGAVAMNIASIFKNSAMKAFHDSTVSVTEMDPMKAFGFK